MTYRNIISPLLFTAATLAGCTAGASRPISDQALLDSVERRTIDYFWSGADPTSGLARERIHLDGIYPEGDSMTVTAGGSGFGLMALVAGIERGYIDRTEGLARFERIVDWLEKADRFHGASPHWWDGSTGRAKSFSKNDNGGDLVETAFLMQGLLTVHQYYVEGSASERALAARIDTLWREVEWSWYTNGKNHLQWHWSPEHEWKMDFPIRGYNECLITYILAAASPTHPITPEVYHQGWAEGGALAEPHQISDRPFSLRYQGGTESPLFWAHYSFLGLDPRGLQDRYANYFEQMRNYTLLNRDYCIRNPKGYEGYGIDCWGLTASYSINGYAAHAPREVDDHGVISPTAALSSIVYTPTESMAVMRNLYAMNDKLWGRYGFYDAFSTTKQWFPRRYLAIDQGPIAVMIENHRSGLLWRLFMSHPDIRRGLQSLGFESPAITSTLQQ